MTSHPSCPRSGSAAGIADAPKRGPARTRHARRARRRSPRPARRNADIRWRHPSLVPERTRRRHCRTHRRTRSGREARRAARAAGPARAPRSSPFGTLRGGETSQEVAVLLALLELDREPRIAAARAHDAVAKIAAAGPKAVPDLRHPRAQEPRSGHAVTGSGRSASSSSAIVPTNGRASRSARGSIAAGIGSGRTRRHATRTLAHTTAPSNAKNAAKDAIPPSPCGPVETANASAAMNCAVRSARRIQPAARRIAAASPGRTKKLSRKLPRGSLIPGTPHARGR